jgi:Rrf2 family protein
LLPDSPSSADEKAGPCAESHFETGGKYGIVVPRCSHKRLERKLLLLFKPIGNTMADLVRISEATALAMHTMGLLARRSSERITTDSIAESLSASCHHLAKVMRRLVKAGLLDSHPGPLGGFQLRVPAEDIPMLRIFEVIEGPLSMDTCLLRLSTCPGNTCRLGSLLGNLQEQLRTFLATTTLAEYSCDSPPGRRDPT